tara:strand:+ start:905 stop:1885 length:981 start_codon:yes stop_codon:yes gene_type:complete
MDKTIKLLVIKAEDNKRLDLYLQNKLKKYSRSLLKKIIETKGVKINGIINFSPSTKVKFKDKITIRIFLNEKNKLKPKKIKFEIVYEDKDILVINKPKGMVVHPGAGNPENTLANALAYKYKNNLSNINGDMRPGIVHRIDKETSGLLVVAKNNLAHSKLGKQFSEHTIKRKYICLIWGVVRPLKGKIETLISRNKNNRQLMTVSDFKGKKAITNYKTIKIFDINEIPKISLIECELKTGRTHQIRVHMRYKGTSIIGDKQYGKKNPNFKKINQNFLESLNDITGQALHAQTLEFIHPTKNKWIDFKTSPPQDFKKMLNLLTNLSG